MAPSDRIPFTVLGGYLGAGKTTVVNELLRSSSERLAVLVNDFGEIDIDTALIESHDGETISLANGCVCCSLSEGFAVALQTVLSLRPPVDQVIVEASGVADPMQVAQWGHSPGFRLNTIAVVVDADSIEDRANDRLVGDTVRSQLRGADLLLLTKTDLVDDTGALRAWISELSTAPILDAPFGRIAMEVLTGSVILDRSSRQPSAESHLEHVTVSIEFEGLVEDDLVAAALRQPPAGLLRAKGLLRLRSAPDSVTVVHLVGRRHSMTKGENGSENATSRLVAIGRPGTPTSALEQWLEQLRPDREG